jgi:hypothetical protein
VKLQLGCDKLSTFVIELRPCQGVFWEFKVCSYIAANTILKHSKCRGLSPNSWVLCHVSKNIIAVNYYTGRSLRYRMAHVEIEIPLIETTQRSWVLTTQP